MRVRLLVTLFVALSLPCVVAVSLMSQVDELSVRLAMPVVGVGIFAFGPLGGVLFLLSASDYMSVVSSEPKHRQRICLWALACAVFSLPLLPVGGVTLFAFGPYLLWVPLVVVPLAASCVTGLVLRRCERPRWIALAPVVALLLTLVATLGVAFLFATRTGTADHAAVYLFPILCWNALMLLAFLRDARGHAPQGRPRNAAAGGAAPDSGASSAHTLAARLRVGGTPKRPRRDRATSIALGGLVGYPLGVLGNVYVMCGLLAVAMAWPGDSSFIHAYLGSYLFGAAVSGLFTGGPVFAIVAVFRPVWHAWTWIFGVCLIASFAGVAFDTAVGWGDYSFFVFPCVALVLGSVVYCARTKHLAPIPPAEVVNDRVEATAHERDTLRRRTRRIGEQWPVAD